MGHKSNSSKKLLQGRNQQQLPAQAKGAEAAETGQEERQQSSRLLMESSTECRLKHAQRQDVMDVENRINFTSVL